MYHGTDYPIEEFDLSENPSSRCFDLCLTDDDSIAEMYATRWGGPESVPTIIEVELVGDLKIASFKEAMALIGECAEMMTTSDAFHAVDSNRAAFLAAGFDGVRYPDQLPGTAEVFECTRIYTEEKVRLVSSWTV